MSVSVEDVKKFLKKREAEKKSLHAELFSQAEQDASRMIKHIKDSYPMVTIYQWGSLLNRGDFDEMSDIDIALEGVPSAKDFFKLYGEIDKMTEFPLDLIELDRIDPISRASILERGKKIYGP